MTGRHRKDQPWALLWFIAALAVLASGIWGYAAFRGAPAAFQRAPAAITPWRPAPRHVVPVMPASTPDAVVIVRPGQALWSIARSHCGTGRDWRHLAHANGIGYPWTITTGERIRVACLPGNGPAAREEDGR
jgi:nucleoid-associated protein YgaU